MIVAHEVIGSNPIGRPKIIVTWFNGRTPVLHTGDVSSILTVTTSSVKHLVIDASVA